MAEQLDLREFLIYAAKNGYANDATTKAHEVDGSATIQIRYGDWLAHDNYFTSEDGRRYHGRMVAFLGNRAMWFCGYSGFVSEAADPGEVYSFLKKAMLQPEEDFPVRGPGIFADGKFTYVFKKIDLNSDLDRFETVETISEAGTLIYEGVFYGGKID